MTAPPGTVSPPTYGPPPTAPGYGPPQKPKTIIPILAGIFLIIAALVGISFWGTLAFLGGAALGIPFVGGILGGILLICGAIGIILAIIALLGGVMAIQRKRWALALVGSILGLFLLGWLFFEASLLSLVALILLIVSRNEF